MFEERNRLVSLDVFRGLTMAGMVVVNNPGDWSAVHAPLLHAEWNGWTPTDLIFPFFLFIVGVSITLSRRSGASVAAIVRRAAIIFGLGLFLAGFPRFDVARWRIPGVLQRIAVCYLAAALWHRGVAARPFRTAAWRTGALVAIILLGYWALIGRDLTPEGNLGARLDRFLMAGHLWKPTWDPEGVLSTLPAIATTLLGVLAGLVVRGLSLVQNPIRLALAGLAGIALGLAWHPLLPINKNLWTGSYVLFTAGWASLILGGLYWIIDVRGVRRWTGPFVILGVNAIALFVLSGLLVKTLALIHVTGADGSEMSLSRYLYVTWYAPLASPKNASLLYALSHLVVLFGVLTVMYRKRIFLKA